MSRTPRPSDDAHRRTLRGFRLFRTRACERFSFAPNGNRRIVTRRGRGGGERKAWLLEVQLFRYRRERITTHTRVIENTRVCELRLVFCVLLHARSRDPMCYNVMRWISRLDCKRISLYAYARACVCVRVRVHVICICCVRDFVKS